MADTLYSDALVNILQDKVTDLAEAGDVKAVKEVISDAQKEAAERTPSPIHTDPWIYRGTVLVLGTAVLLVALAQYHITLEAMQPGGRPTAIPDGLIAIGSAAIGALAGLLAPTPTR